MSTKELDSWTPNLFVLAFSRPPPLRRLPRDAAFFAYSWKLPAYSGAFSLTIDNFSFLTHSWSFFAYNFSFFAYSWSFFAYSGKASLIRTLRDCKQRSLTVSKKAPTVSKQASSPFSAPLVTPPLKNLLLGLFLMVCFREVFKWENGPLRHSRQRPINRERKEHIKRKTRKQNIHGIVPGFWGNFVYVFFLTHKE